MKFAIVVGWTEGEDSRDVHRTEKWKEICKVALMEIKGTSDKLG